MPRDLPPGGEDERSAKLPAHLQRHQRDAHQHAGARHDQLVLCGVTPATWATGGDLLCHLQTQDETPKLIPGHVPDAGRPSTRRSQGDGRVTGNKERGNFIACFLEESSSREHSFFFLNLAGNIQRFHCVLTEVCGGHSSAGVKCYSSLQK